MTKSIKKNKTINIEGRPVGDDFPPLVIAEAGINHEGDFNKAIQLIDAAVAAKAECVKFQCHITEEEMIPTDILPGNSPDRLYDIIKRCELPEEEELAVKKYCEKKGIIYLCTPFSRAAADRLYDMKVNAFKIGSGECNSIPLLEHIARMGKPMILSTGMNDIPSIRRSVKAIQKHKCPLILMHCTSMYPTPYEKVRLGAIAQLKKTFGLPVGLSDHSLGIYTCLGAAALGACALEKHFTLTRDWPGPDVPISMEPQELAQLVEGSRAIYLAQGGTKNILKEEQPVIDFAYACAVAICDIKAGEIFSLENIWVKRPGTGEIKAVDFHKLLGKKARAAVKKDAQLRWKSVAA